MVKTLCIVQARLTSSRLPNKVLMTLGNSNLSILEHIYQRLNMSRYIDKVVFAIPNSAKNNPLAEFMGGKNIPYTRGSENDVLDKKSVRHFSLLPGAVFLVSYKTVECKSHGDVI